MQNPKLPIAFQGEYGANSDLAARNVFPKAKTLPCTTFEDVYTAVREGKAAYGMIPIDNTIAGRVADIHHLLPHSGVFIVGEYFLPIKPYLLGIPGAKLSDIKEVRSHVHALAQSKQYLAKHHLKAVVAHDTAGAARLVGEMGDKTIAAIAPSLAGKLYGLTELARNIEDREGNTTRFIIISKHEEIPKAGKGMIISSLFFRLRSTPAALYKAIGGFASSGVNLIKLESYINDGFENAEFYAEAEAHPHEERMKHALDELKYFSDEVRVLGVYPAHAYRRKKKTKK